MVKAEFIGISSFGSPLRRSLRGLRLRTEMTLRDIPVFRSAYSASQNARAPAASRPPPAHRNDPSGHSGVPLGLFGKPKRSSSSRFAAFGGRGELRSPLSPHRTSSSSCSGVPHGLFMISHHRPCGRWCFARLIRQAETLELQLHSQPPSKRTALSELKRSCFRFAPLTLRCRTESAFQAVPVFRMAYS